MPHPMDDFWAQVLGPLSNEISHASWKHLQERFWMRTGKPAYDETYESRMQAFQEWICIDGHPPCLLARLASQGRFQEHIAQMAFSLASSHFGLFVLMAPWKQTAWFRDLLGGADFILHETPPIFGLVPGQIVQTRIFAYQNECWFTLGRVVHPENATETIYRLLPLLRKQGFSDLDILHILMKMEWRSRLHFRINPVNFYNPTHPLVQTIIAEFPRETIEEIPPSL